MRSLKSLFLVGLVAVLSIGYVMYGCSDDDKSTTTTNNDPTIEEMLVQVAPVINAQLDSAVAVMESGLGVAVYIGTGGSTEIGDLLTGPAIPDSVNELNGWIVSYITDLQSGVGLNETYDSLTYLHVGQLSVNAANADGMRYIHNFQFTSADTTSTHTDHDFRMSLQVIDIQTDTATISGTMDVVINEKEVETGGTEWNDWAMEATFTDVTVTRDGSSFDTGCPCSGTISITLEHSVTVDDAEPTVTVWQFEVTFDHGTATVNATTGTSSTDYEVEVCTL